MNAFPLLFIDKCVQKFLNKLFLKRNKPQYHLQKEGIAYFIKYHYMLRNSWLKFQTMSEKY